MRRKLLTLFILIFWVLTSSASAFEFNLNQYSFWGDNPEGKIDRRDRYAISTNNGNYIYLDSNPRLWYSFWFTGFDFYYELNSRYNYTKFIWFAYKYENEWITFFQAKYKWAVQYYNTFTIPSRTAYQYTNSIGNKFLFSEIFLNDNQFTLYDPESNYWVSWIGDVRLENLMLISNPWKEEQNVFLIQLQKQKAFSLTVDKNQAWEIWKGNWVNKNFLKNLNFEKSYTLTSWGNYLFPPGFKQVNQGRGFIYTEDIETQSMDWWGGATNNPNQWGNSDGSYKERLAEYNQCASYWQNVKTYTLYDRECYRWLLDDPADNRDFDIRLAPWKAIVDWNWEGELDIKTKDPICLKFKSRKPVYMAKYKEKRDEFIKDSQEYWLNPSQTINVAEKCGTRPEFKPKELDDASVWEKILWWLLKRSDKISGNEYVWKVGDKLVKKADIDSSLIDLTLLKAKCDNPVGYMPFVPVWQVADYKKKFCDEYAEAKKKHDEKYSKTKFFTWFQDLYSWWKNVDDLGLNKIVNYFKKDYDNGYNFFQANSCKNPVLLKEWDYLVYIPFMIVCFFFIRYMLKYCENLWK